MNKIALAFVVLSLIPAAARDVFAGQTSTVQGVGCIAIHPGAPNDWNERCNSPDDCKRKADAHNAQWHSGQSVASSRAVARRRTPNQAIAFGLLGGGGGGALGGSLHTSAAGNNQALNGALAGAGAGTVLAVTANASKINPVAGAVLAAGGGAAAGTAWARYQIEQGKPDTTTRDAAIGAGSGVALFGLKKMLGGSKAPPSPQFAGRHLRIDFIASLRFTGVRVRW